MALALDCAAALLRQWQIEMDNNAAERALRAVALGRKNYMFAGSDAGRACRSDLQPDWYGQAQCS